MNIIQFVVRRFPIKNPNSAGVNFDVSKMPIKSGARVGSPVLSGFPVFFLMTALLLNSCNLPGAIPPTAAPTIPPAGAEAEAAPLLRAGLTMAWADGSTLIFVPQGQKGFWITTNPISNYQLSLCVQSGKCTPPTDPDSSKKYNDPSGGNRPVSMTGADSSAGYCAWAGGHVPSDTDLADFTDELRNAGFTDELRIGFHCIVDTPRPMAQYCQISAYHDPAQPIEDPNHAITPKGTFCQNGTGYVTLDIELDPTDMLQSIVPQGKNENCQVVDGSRIVCGGIPGTSTSITAGIMDSSIAGIMDSNIAGEDDWELTAGGAPIPTNGVKFLDLGLRSGYFAPHFVFVNGTVITQSLSMNGLSENGLSSNSLAENSMAVNGLAFNGITHPVCPVGYYFDDKTNTCVAPAPPTDSTCLSGYKLDQTNLCCAAFASNGSYPGCPTGQILDPLTGACDPRTTLISQASSLNMQTFDLTFPACNKGSGGTVSCGSITSDTICNKTPGCSFDIPTKTCK